MDDDLKKRNTDCVYFLASPLTCKKGNECEFRHSDFARLNPRDCWYWLAGNCLNPTCGYRHPPLEGHPENPSESTSLPQPSLPVNKNNVPCYFYFNSFCNKGDTCSFLHGSTTVTSKPPSTLTNGEIPPKEQLEITQYQPKLEAAPSPQDSLPEREEEAIVRSEIHLISPNPDQSSEDQEPEDRGESSPGFDVLVDDEDQEYFEDVIAYNSLDYPDYEHSIYDYHVQQVPIRSREDSRNPNDSDLRNHLRKRRRITQERSKHHGNNKSRQQERERRRQARPRSRPRTRPSKFEDSQSITFTGPKTLAEIKEEKRKARGISEEEKFEGPKAFSEILKEKRRIGSSDDNSSSRSRYDRFEDEEYMVDEFEDNESLVM